MYSFPYTYSYKKRTIHNDVYLGHHLEIKKTSKREYACLILTYWSSMQTIGWAFSRFYVSDRQTHNTNTQTHLHYLYMYIKLRMTRMYRYSFCPSWKASKTRSRTSIDEQCGMSPSCCATSNIVIPFITRVASSIEVCPPLDHATLPTLRCLLQHSDWWTSFSTGANHNQSSLHI